MQGLIDEEMMQLSPWLGSEIIVNTEQPIDVKDDTDSVTSLAGKLLKIYNTLYRKKKCMHLKSNLNLLKKICSSFS